MIRHYIGIDPGNSGAIAVITPVVSMIEFFDCPVFTVGKKIELDSSGMAAILKPFYPFAIAGLERVHSMPQQGVASTFKFGVNYGAWLGILAAIGFPHELITPQAWKKSLMDGQNKDKDASRQVALRLFPQCADNLKLKKHHGRADALLIAEFLRRKLNV